MPKTDPDAQLPVVPLPPKDANVTTTCCDYCVVGCGYKVYTWPVDGESGGPTADKNAYGAAFPTEQLTGQWVTPNQHSQCVVDGQQHHIVVAPDADSSVVNVGGNHSIRGGCIAQKVYNPKARPRIACPSQCCE